MSPKAVKEHWQHEPFRPFRIHLSDGPSSDVHERGHLFLDARIVVTGLSEVIAGIPERGTRVDPVHITRIDPIGRGSANGYGRTKN